MAIQSLGSNEYQFTYDNDPQSSEHLKADGSFRLLKAQDSFEESFEKTGENQWTIKNKPVEAKDKSHYETILKLASDGKTMISSWEAVSPKGEASKGSSLFTRTKEGKGLDGQWQETKVLTYQSPKRILTVKNDGSGGMIVSNSYSDNIQSLKTLDDKLYKPTGPTASSREASSAKLVNDHLLKMTDYRDGKVSLKGDWTISSNGKVLTMMLRVPGEEKSFPVRYQKQP